MSKAADILTVEVGSTFTKLIFYRCDGGRLTLGGRASGLTTIGCGDVSLGYRQLLSRLDSTYGVSRFGEIYLSSSAAGGLRVVVCGLTRNLTTKAALESALGAGGIVLESITGLISKRQAAQLAEMNPGMILLCGGLDGGEEATLLQNAAIVSELPVDATIVYAGNQAIREEVREILVSKNKKVVLSESNVYPRVDEFRFREVQDIIRRAFEINVVKAPGIEAIQRETRPPIPTPLAVSYATELLGQEIGNLIVFDVGGATTDVHSYVSDGQGQDRVQATIEPPMKRSVEGDLGVFYNLENLMEAEEHFSPGSPTD